MRVELSLWLFRPQDRPKLGLKFQNHPASGKTMQQGEFEPDEAKWFKDQLQSHSVFINVGANVGLYAARAGQCGLKVIAFEPEPQNVRFLLRNLESNNVQDYEVYPVAASNSRGALALFGGSTGASTIKGWAKQHGIQLVPTLRLDDVISRRFEDLDVLMVCDVEGAELYVLQGALGSISSFRTLTLLLELERMSEHQPGGVNPNYEATLDLLEENGFSPGILGEGGERSTTFAQLRSLDKSNSPFTSHDLIFRKTRESDSKY